MSGGTYEFTAAYLKNYYTSIGFTEDPESIYGEKYFDKYTGETYNAKILGDATGEMGPFYQYKDDDESIRYHNSWWANNSGFINNIYPCFVRGGLFINGFHASQNTFFAHKGNDFNQSWDDKKYYTFRIILTI